MLSYNPAKKQVTLRFEAYSVSERPEPIAPEEGRKQGRGKFELGMEEGVELLEQYLEEATFALDMLQDARTIPPEPAE